MRTSPAFFGARLNRGRSTRLDPQILGPTELGCHFVLFPYLTITGARKGKKAWEGKNVTRDGTIIENCFPMCHNIISRYFVAWKIAPRQMFVRICVLVEFGYIDIFSNNEAI